LRHCHLLLYFFRGIVWYFGTMPFYVLTKVLLLLCWVSVIFVDDFILFVFICISSISLFCGVMFVVLLVFGFHFLFLCWLYMYIYNNIYYIYGVLIV